MLKSRIMHVYMISAILFLCALTSFAYGMKLNDKDYTITGFGMKDGNPFITVQGTAGGTYDPSMGDEGYEAYVFNTDKGIFQITVAEGSSNKPYYSVDHILNKQLKVNECLLTEGTHGKPQFNNNTVMFVDHKQNFTKINKAYAIQVTSDDPDETCANGQHIRKIFPNQTNAIVTETKKTVTPIIENNILVNGTTGSVDINTSSGEYQCNGSPSTGKINGLYVDSYNRHGTLAGQWALVNEKSNGEDTSGKITGGSVSASAYNLSGKTNTDGICPTIYDDIIINGECGEDKIVQMKTSDGKHIASLKGNARCSAS